MSDLNKKLFSTYKFKEINKLKPYRYDCILISVGHKIYKKIGIKKIRRLSSNKDCKIYDLKSIFSKEMVHYQL